MSKIEKIKKVLNGELTEDIPFSFWTHFPDIDRIPELIAEETYQFYKRFDLDFIKTMNNGMYATEDYGCKIDYSKIENGGVAEIISTPIESYTDWKKLKTLDLQDAPALQRELTYLRLLLERVQGEVPVVITVFSPLTIADKISGGKILESITEEEKGGQLFKSALEKISKITAEFVAEAISIGADGIYFASQVSTFERLSAQQYLEYGRPYDLKVLEKAQNAWFNTVHLHGNKIMFDVVKDYPVQAINWHIGESYPTPREGQIYSQKVIMGGINRWDVTASNFNELHHQIYRTIFGTQGKGLILAPVCVIPKPYDDGIIDYLKKVKQETQILFNDNYLESSLL